MNKNALFILLLLTLPALSARATSHEDIDALLPLSLEALMDMQVSISTNSLQKLSKAPSVVSVITAEDIKTTGATNLTDILQSVPGVYIRHNQFGYRPLVTMRGAAAPHTLLMINGSPIKDLAWSAGIFWKGLPVSMIERVEIIRGPGSALFGSDASAGVINVITKTAGKIMKSEIGVRAGKYDSQSGWLQHGAEWNGFDIAFTADVSHTDGHRPFFARDGQTSRGDVSYAPGRADTGWDNQDIRLSVSQGSWRVMADHMRHSNLETGITGAAVLDPLTRASDSNSSIALLYGNSAFAKDWGLNAELRFRETEYDAGDGFLERPPGYRCTVAGALRCAAGVAPGTYANGHLNIQNAAERRMNFEVSGLYSGFRQHTIRLGAGYVWQDPYKIRHAVNFGTIEGSTVLPAGGPLVDISGTSFAFSPEISRKNSYAFLQDVWSFATDWELTAGLRYDDYSDFGNALTPRLALVWQTTNRLTSKLMYGEAFRAPAYLELYSRTAASLPNTNLKPEESRTWDMSFSYLASNDMRLGLSLYHFAIDDIITANGGQFINGGNHVIRGAELEAQWQAAKSLMVSGNYSRRRQSYDDPLVVSYGIPDEEAYLRADWSFHPQWTWNLQANWTGARELRSTDTRRALGSHTLADTTLRYTHDRHWEFAASLRNLFDKDAAEYTGSSAFREYLPLPGRNFFAEVRYKF